MSADPLALLMDLPGVAEAVARVRDEVTAVHRHPANRSNWPATAAEASVRAARASAALDGGSTALPGDGPVFAAIDSYVHQRLAILASNKEGRRGRNWKKRFTYSWARSLGIHRLGGTVRYYRTAHA